MDQGSSFSSPLPLTLGLINQIGSLSTMPTWNGLHGARMQTTIIADDNDVIGRMLAYHCLYQSSRIVAFCRCAYEWNSISVYSWKKKKLLEKNTPPPLWNGSGGYPAVCWQAVLPLPRLCHSWTKNERHSLGWIKLHSHSPTLVLYNIAYIVYILIHTLARKDRPSYWMTTRAFSTGSQWILITNNFALLLFCVRFLRLRCRYISIWSIRLLNGLYQAYRFAIPATRINF